MAVRKEETMRYCALVSSVVVFAVATEISAQPRRMPDRNQTAAAGEHSADWELLVSKRHAESLELRRKALRRTIDKDTCWPGGTWGENLWALAALSLNERTEEANARLLRHSREFVALVREQGDLPAPTPEQPGKAPWTFFSITDYVRTLSLFHARSAHFPGRLKPESEAAMKEALWLWVRRESRVDQMRSEDLLLLLGTENHDLNKRPNHYLVLALLADDPGYRERKLADGHTVSEHAAACTAFFRAWPASRAASGLWAEVGSNGYQKYSWPALFNLHELSPDPLIRHRFGLLLDLALIEEAQISVKGRRGGGRSRAYYTAGGFESMKAMLYGEGGGSSHSRVIESSLYQAPPEAILLRCRTFPAAQPFVIRNRVLGELETVGAADGEGQRLAADSALVNYAYRTAHSLLGSTLQNPALSAPGAANDAPVLKYAGISRQNRTCGLLFDNPSAKSVSQIHPVAEHTGGGRSQHSFWSVQHESVLILQRIARLGRSTIGSYNTGKFGMRFEGADLLKLEENGWIFATDGKAYVGVRFLDGPYRWDDKRLEVFPANFAGQSDTTRILLHAGDVADGESFEQFRKRLSAHPPAVSADTVEYRCAKSGNRIEMHLYDPQSPATFALPRVNGSPVELRPATTYQSPYLNGRFGDARITVTVAPLTRLFDFSEGDQGTDNLQK